MMKRLMVRGLPTRLPRILCSSVPSYRRLGSTTPQFPLDDGAGQHSLFCDLKSRSSPGFGGPHDLGGVEALLGTILDTSEVPLAHWEQETHALLVSLVGARLLSVDELRRHIEGLEPAHYLAWSYYEKWGVAMAHGLVERGGITAAQRDTALGFDPPESGDGNAAPAQAPKFRVGQAVVVGREESLARWRKPHLRTPGYLFGCRGVVASQEGRFGDPEFLAFRHGRPGATSEHLYRVTFQLADVWPEHASTHSDTVTVEVYEPWLEASAASDDHDHDHDDHDHGHSYHDHNHNHGHTHGANDEIHDHGDDNRHGHGHSHEPRPAVEQRAVSSEGPERPGERVAVGLLGLLASKGLVDRAALRRLIDANESAGKRLDGATLVAKAWADPAFKARLLIDASAAAAEVGISATNSTTHTKLKAVASSAKVHHLVVCTLCSCYPLSLLGLSPAWYKSRAYRARAVREPRRLLADSFGLIVPPEVEVHVHDSTADLRILVVPTRPPHTEGWTEAMLRPLATRDSMIGVALAMAPPLAERVRA